MELREWEMEIFEQNAFSNISLKMEGFGVVIYKTPIKVFINWSSAHPAPEPASSNFKQDQFGKAFAEQFSAGQMERAIIHTTGGLHSFYL